jgi:hypothetical protein
MIPLMIPWKKKRYVIVIPNVYPNPFSGWVNLDLGNNVFRDLELQVFNMIGQEVPVTMNSIKPGSHYIISLINQNPGVYYLKVKASGYNLSRKIVLLRK